MSAPQPAGAPASGPIAGPYTTAIPSAPNIHNEPPLAYQWRNANQDQLGVMKNKLIDLILETIVGALQGFVNPVEDIFDQLVAFFEQIPLIGPLIQALTGAANGTLATLAQWTENIPIIGDLVRAITQFFDPSVHVDLGFLGNWFSDLLGVFGLGGDSGLGTGSVDLGPIDDIPFVGPIISGIVGSITGVLGGGFSFLRSWFEDILSLFGFPINLGSGSPGLIDPEDIPILGPAFGFIHRLIDGILTAIENIPFIGGTIADMIEAITGMRATGSSAHAIATSAQNGVNSLGYALGTAPENALGGIGKVAVDSAGGTVGELLDGLYAAAKPTNTATGGAGGTGGGTVRPPPSPAGVPTTVIAVYNAVQGVKGAVSNAGTTNDSFYNNAYSPAPRTGFMGR